MGVVGFSEFGINDSQSQIEHEKCSTKDNQCEVQNRCW
jgi:hypothetical protein